MREPVVIEGLTLSELHELPREDVDALLAFGRPISFTIGSAAILAEFNRFGDRLHVNLAHIDGGGEGVLVVLWKLIGAYARERGCETIRWNVHAATCASPNPRLQRFLHEHGFQETDDPDYGRIFLFEGSVP